MRAKTPSVSNNVSINLDFFPPNLKVWSETSTESFGNITMPLGEWIYDQKHCKQWTFLPWIWGPIKSWKWSETRSVMSDSLWPHGLYSPWSSPGQNTGVGSFSLLQGSFPTQGLNPSHLHCRWILYQLSHKESPCNIIAYFK